MYVPPELQEITTKPPTSNHLVTLSFILVVISCTNNQFPSAFSLLTTVFAKVTKAETAQKSGSDAEYEPALKVVEAALRGALVVRIPTSAHGFLRPSLA
jgi:hypothetical protein